MRNVVCASWRIGMVLTLIVVVGALNALPASAQCTSTATSADLTTRGNPKYQGGTTQNECSGRTVEVAVWIDGNLPDSACSWDNCMDTETEGNAVQQVWGLALGIWEAHSTHRYNDGGAWASLPNQSRTLNAGRTPEEECQDGGGQWDPDMEVCEDYDPGAGGSPIIINISKNSKYKLTSAADGVFFDLDGDGVPERIGWTEAGSEVAFLAIDRNGDGKITSGKELFGNFTLPGAPNGFVALQRLAMESNGGVLRGSVSSDDPIYSRLLLWTDTNHDGVSESSELRAVGDVISDIGLGYQEMRRIDGNGNEFRFRGWVHIRTAQGRNKVESKDQNKERTRSIWDVFFAIQR